MGLDEVISTVNAEDRLLIVDDVFDSGNTVNIAEGEYVIKRQSSSKRARKQL